MAARAWPDADPVDAIMAVMERAFDPEFGEAWNRRQVSDALVLGTCRAELMDTSGAIGEITAGAAAGFYLARDVVGEEELLLFAIAPQFRGKGLGSALLEHFLDSARVRGMSRVFLEMRRGNTAASLYGRYGFVSVGERRGYYRGARGLRYDAISYELKLP